MLSCDFRSVSADIPTSVPPTAHVRRLRLSDMGQCLLCCYVVVRYHLGSCLRRLRLLHTVWRRLTGERISRYFSLTYLITLFFTRFKDARMLM